MEKKHRIRYELAAANRANASGTTARQDDIQIIRNKYDLSTGAQKRYSIFYCASS